jgi:hypothetical protein
VERCLSKEELLAALDAPAERVKEAPIDTLSQWSGALKLPFKVRAEICEWMYATLSNLRKVKRDSNEEHFVSAKRQKVEESVTEGEALSEDGLEQLGVDEDPPVVTPLVPTEDAQGNQKAAKHDDAEVPTHLWNERARQGSRLKLSDRQLDCVRVCALKYWKRLVAKGFHDQCRQWRIEARQTGKKGILEWI